MNARLLMCIDIYGSGRLFVGEMVRDTDYRRRWLGDLSD